MNVCNNIVFVPGKPFQPSLTFVGKARSLTQSGTTERRFTGVCSGLTCKHKTRLQRLARDKHSSLSQTFINNICKKLYNIVSCEEFSYFFLHNLHGNQCNLVKILSKYGTNGTNNGLKKFELLDPMLKTFFCL